ncbi:DUF3344 domain-containing protein [Streptomyces ovatisporus]|uniref:DUF3344 domain-containing protein n=1 Tax=Streptomyces ovatisporus TaxID=1128682 RepID=A0ABV9AD21_9ACTN
MVDKKRTTAHGLWCAALCAAATVSLTAPASSATHTAAQKEASGRGASAEAPSGNALKERYHAVKHGGIARAANSSITCRSAVGDSAPCDSAQQGGAERNDGYKMFYSDIDRDKNTYNSTRAALRLPKNSKVSYARLYWGGNLRVGEVKPAKDNGRVLVTEPGGSYRAVKADTVRKHRRHDGADAYQASANVTSLVRNHGPGAYTVAQLNVAMGHSKAGAWGGWTLVVAYENSKSPLRDLTIWDGFAATENHPGGLPLATRRTNIPANAKGSVGVVGYDGDRGSGGESFTLAANRRAGTPLSNSANPAGDTFNSTITDRGSAAAGRVPAHRNTLGYDSDVFDAGEALRAGASSLLFRFASPEDDYLLGAVFAQFGTRR